MNGDDMESRTVYLGAYGCYKQTGLRDWKGKDRTGQSMRVC